MHYASSDIKLLSTHATDQLGWRCTVWTHLTQPEPCVVSTATRSQHN